MYSQQFTTSKKQKLKQKILQSSELKAWQKAMITFQKSHFELCSLTHVQKKKLSLSHTFSNQNKQKDYTLKLFRIMRITDDLKDSVTIKEKKLRKKFPEIAIHFIADELFAAIYAPIIKAREARSR